MTANNRNTSPPIMVTAEREIDSTMQRVQISIPEDFRHTCVYLYVTHGSRGLGGRDYTSDVCVTFVLLHPSNLNIGNLPGMQLGSRELPSTRLLT